MFQYLTLCTYISIKTSLCSYMLYFNCLQQFAQFALMTQAVAVFCTYVLGYIGSHKVKVILSGLLVSNIRSLSASISQFQINGLMNFDAVSIV